MCVGHRLCVVQRLGLTSLQRYNLSASEHLLATGQCEFVDQFDGLRLFGVVFDLGVDEDGIAWRIIPDVNTEGLDAHGIRLDEADRAEDTERLRTLAESPFRGTTAANPG